jgi:hypothetical protein
MQIYFNSGIYCERHGYKYCIRVLLSLWVLNAVSVFQCLCTPLTCEYLKQTL